MRTLCIKTPLKICSIHAGLVGLLQWVSLHYWLWVTAPRCIQFMHCPAVNWDGVFGTSKLPKHSANPLSCILSQDSTLKNVWECWDKLLAPLQFTLKITWHFILENIWYLWRQIFRNIMAENSSAAALTDSIMRKVRNETNRFCLISPSNSF